MGLSIRGNYKGSIELDGGYGMLETIRNQVAKEWDKEFGEHYATLRYCNTENDFAMFTIKANKIINSGRLREKTKQDADILDFLFASDYGDTISYKTCKKIYELIKDTKCNYCLRYAAYSNNDWEDFKQLLRECYSHRSKLVWY